MPDESTPTLPMMPEMIGAVPAASAQSMINDEDVMATAKALQQAGAFGK